MNGTLETHHPADLALYSQNPRMGDVDAIAASLRAHGQYKPVVLNRGTHTGRPMEVLAGNHTVKAFRTLAEKYPSDDRWQEVHCWVVDVDEDRAARIVAVDNRTSDLGSFDDQVLSDLLSSLPDLEGTGYSDDDLEMLNDILDGAPDLDELGDEYGEPEEKDFNITLRFSVAPHVADQWGDWANGYDSDEEAFEALLDRGAGK